MSRENFRLKIYTIILIISISIFALSFYYNGLAQELESNGKRLGPPQDEEGLVNPVRIIFPLKNDEVRPGSSIYVEAEASDEVHSVVIGCSMGNYFELEERPFEASFDIPEDFLSAMFFVVAVGRDEDGLVLGMDTVRLQVRLDPDRVKKWYKERIDEQKKNSEKTFF